MATQKRYIREIFLLQLAIVCLVVVLCVVGVQAMYGDAAYPGLSLPAIAVALAAVVAATWMGYRATKRVVAPVDWVLQEVARWDPTRPDTSALALEFDADGKVRMRHCVQEIGTGATTAQQVIVRDMLGKAPDFVEFGVAEFAELPMVSNWEPYSTTQEQQEREVLSQPGNSHLARHEIVQEYGLNLAPPAPTTM